MRPKLGEKGEKAKNLYTVRVFRATFATVIQQMKRLLKTITSSDDRRAEFLRFCIVGGIATLLHYAIYLLLQKTIMTRGAWLSVAYTLGYGLSLVANFFLTTYFTFRSNASTARAAGFGLSHVVNYTLQIALFNLFVWLGVWNELAPLCAMAIALPVNYALLHLIYKRLTRKKHTHEPQTITT